MQSKNVYLWLYLLGHSGLRDYRTVCEVITFGCITAFFFFPTEMPNLKENLNSDQESGQRAWLHKKGKK